MESNQDLFLTYFGKKNITLSYVIGKYYNRLTKTITIVT